MKPVTPFDNFPSFGNAGSRQAPGDAKYALGFVAADTLPAEWANYFFHGSTKGVSDLNTAVRSIWLELSSVLTAYNITADASESNQLYTAIEKRLSSLYPIGTIYQNADSDKNPGRSDMLGFGTWEPITDKFLAARGSTNIGASGGAWSKTLTSAEIPQHTHSMQHWHQVDIMHGHGVTDLGHQHTKLTNSGGGENIICKFNSGRQVGGYPRMAIYDHEYEYGEDIVTDYVTSRVSVNNLAEADRLRFTSEGGYFDGTNWVNVRDTGSYGSANPTAISLIPTYVGVYTWKRTA